MILTDAQDHILEYLLRADEPKTVREIHTATKSWSLGTVYYALSILRHAGLARMAGSTSQGATLWESDRIPMPDEE